MTKLYNCVRLVCLTITLVVLGSATGQTFAQGCGNVDGYSLMNSSTGQYIMEINNGDVLTANQLPEYFHIQIETDGYVGSLTSTIGNTSYNSSYAPYDFPADTSWELGNGTFTISAEIFDNYNGSGQPCDQDAISFSITGLPDSYQDDVQCDALLYSFTLVDSDTGNEITEIYGGETISTSILPENYHLRSSYTGNVTCMVTEVNGVATENDVAAPFEYPSNGTSWNAGPGYYTVVSRAFNTEDANGPECDVLETSFTIEDDSAGCGTIDGFDLINSNTGEVVATITDGAEIEEATLPSNYHIRIQTTGNSISSVITDVNGYERTQNDASWDYPNDSGYWNEGAGEYVLTSTAYDRNYGNGAVCDQLSISFSIIGEPCGSITGYQLVDSYTGDVITAIQDNGAIDIETLPEEYHIEVLTEGNSIESVIIEVNGSTKTENHAPYDYYSSGYYSSWEGGLGEYVVSSTAYDRNYGNGAICDESGITFSIIVAPCEYVAGTEDQDYVTSDTEQCNAGGFYQLWTAEGGQALTVGETTFVENPEDGTAEFTGVFKEGQDTITVNAVFSGMTTEAPSGEGANVTSQSGTQLGASGWFYLDSDHYCPAYTEGDFNFNLETVTAAPNYCETLEFVDLPNNILLAYDANVGGAVAEWTAPIASTVFGNIDVVQVEGPASGSVFAEGTTTTISYKVADEFGCENVASFTVTVGELDPCVETVVQVVGFSVFIKNPTYAGQTISCEFYDLENNLQDVQLVRFDRNGETLADPSLGFGYFVVRVLGETLVCSQQFFFSPEE